VPWLRSRTERSSTIATRPREHADAGGGNGSRAARQLASALLLLGLVGCGREDRESSSPGARLTRWEYRFVGANTENLRAAGQDGWEAFATDKDERGETIVWLKRPLEDGKP
jgi:hypothetical protein